MWLLAFHSSEWFQCVRSESGISLSSFPQTPMCLPYVLHHFWASLTLRLLYLSSFSLSFQIPPRVVALWPHLLTAASKWCDCACVCVCMWTSVESLTWARRECGSTALLNPGNSLRTTRHGWHPESSTEAKVCLTHSRSKKFTHMHSVRLHSFHCLESFLLSVWTLDGISLALEAYRLSMSSNK